MFTRSSYIKKVVNKSTTKQGALKAINRLETKRLIFRDKNGKDTFYRIVK